MAIFNSYVSLPEGNSPTVSWFLDRLLPRNFWVHTKGLRQSLQQLQAPWPAADGMERSAHGDDVRRALGDPRVG